MHLAQGSEVVIAHLGLECVLGVVAATEALADVVVVPAEPGMPSPKRESGCTGWGPGPLSSARPIAQWATWELGRAVGAGARAHGLLAPHGKWLACAGA